MQKMKQYTLLRGDSELSSCVVVEISSSCGELRLVDLVRDDGTLRGVCWLCVGNISDWDGTTYLYEAFKALEKKEKESKVYKDLKDYVKEGGLSFKDCKQELLVMFKDAEKLGMFNGK